MSSFSRELLESWLKTIDVKCDRVLDIGGSQLPIKGRTKSWEVKDYKILDLEQPHIEKQKADIIYDLNCIDDFYANEYKYFDIAFCLEVSEYWYDPRSALRNINSFLKTGGILYLSTHFVYPVHNPVEDDCLRYTRNGIIKLLEKTGFKVEEIKEREMTNSGKNFLDDFIGNERMRPAKDYQFHNSTGNLIKAIKL